ncbi:SDR family oxidoreductase [soil metagenome]
MDLGIRGKKALVTGASKGIGRAIVQALSAEGVEVIAASRDQTNLEALAAGLWRKNAPLHIFSADLSQGNSRKELIDYVGKTFKDAGIDILVHNVGGPKPTDTAHTSADDWQAGFEQLFQSVAELNGAFLPGMKERNFGRVLCVTSLSVMEPINGLAISNSLRAAVTAMLKSLASEVAAQNITVNCVAPGAIATDRLTDLMAVRMAKSGQSEEEYNREYLASIPAGRLGTPEEFASVVTYLASVQAAYITGSTICVDGGKRRSTY